MFYAVTSNICIENIILVLEGSKITYFIFHLNVPVLIFFEQSENEYYQSLSLSRVSTQ